MHNNKAGQRRQRGAGRNESGSRRVLCFGCRANAKDTSGTRVSEWRAECAHLGIDPLLDIEVLLPELLQVHPAPSPTTTKIRRSEVDWIEDEAWPFFQRGRCEFARYPIGNSSNSILYLILSGEGGGEKRRSDWETNGEGGAELLSVARGGGRGRRMLALGGKFLNGVSNAVKDQLAHPWDIKVSVKPTRDDCTPFPTPRVPRALNYDAIAHVFQLPTHHPHRSPVPALHYLFSCLMTTSSPGYVFGRASDDKWTRHGRSRAPQSPPARGLMLLSPDASPAPFTRRRSTVTWWASVRSDAAMHSLGGRGPRRGFCRDCDQVRAHHRAQWRPGALPSSVSQALSVSQI